MARPQNPDMRLERRMQILEAARAAFAAEGVAGVRMDDIARRSGLSKGTLYLYYKDKDELIAGLLYASLDGALEQLRGLLADGPQTVESRLMDYAASVAHEMEADTGITAITYGFYAIAGQHPAVRTALQRYFAEYRQVLESLFARGADNGEYPQIDAALRAVALIALWEGAVLLWFTDPESIRLADVLPRLIRQFFDGFRHTGDAR